MSEIQNIILNTSEPILIKKAFKWGMLNWTLEKWTEILGCENLSFRLGLNSFTERPQYENTTKSVQMAFKDFLQFQQTNCQNWLYFDYKYLKEWLINIPELREQINWSDLGFPNLSADDSTIWIGSKGAHTPCHADTYGCNIVAQIYGHKKWILFPPTENLVPTRIPYEESSIYSQLNFYTPSLDKFKDVKHCRVVVLEPGDVLILPHKWWHYVENLDLAISINTWIPLPIDHEERLCESLVQTIIFQLTNNLDEDLKAKIVNPQQEIPNGNLIESIDVVLSALMLHNIQKDEALSTPTNLKNIYKQFSNFHAVDELVEEEFQKMLRLHNSRFECGELIAENEEEKRIAKVVNAMLHPDVVNLIKNKLLHS